MIYRPEGFNLVYILHRLASEPYKTSESCFLPTIPVIRLMIVEDDKLFQLVT
jgi:hypothetical protein